MSKASEFTCRASQFPRAGSRSAESSREKLTHMEVAK